VSSILLLQQRRVLMVDCGEGTVNQLAAAGIDPILVQG
jgi:ribonuclease BN (tRNA processing enzyme)